MPSTPRRPSRPRSPHERPTGRPGPPRAPASRTPPPDADLPRLLEEARIALAEGRLEAARRAAINAKQAAPRAPAARELLGRASFALGSWHEAAQELLAFRRFSGERRADPMIAECRTNEGRPDKALDFLADLSRGTVDDAVWADAEIARARAHAARGNIELARRVLLTASRSVRARTAKAKLADAVRDLA